MNQIRKISKIDDMPYKEKVYIKYFWKFKKHVRIIRIPIIICNEAKSLYSIISKTKISRGSNRKGILAACV